VRVRYCDDGVLSLSPAWGNLASGGCVTQRMHGWTATFVRNANTPGITRQSESAAGHFPSKGSGNPGVYLCDIFVKAVFPAWLAHAWLADFLPSFYPVR